MSFRAAAIILALLACPVLATAEPSRFAATGRADRIVLTPGADPSTDMAVAYRTRPGMTVSQAQLAPALDGAALEAKARVVVGKAHPIDNENGPALYHQIRFTGLAPDAPYAYRVREADGWSPWLQFRTAAKGFRPFSFIYLGDTQNDILSGGARTIRQAFHAVAQPALMLHAGDLVAQGKVKVHDDEWGEWTEAGGYNFAMVPQLPAPGNHEYVSTPDGPRLGPHWSAQFSLPDNGAPSVRATTYFVDYQGVRFVVLDGTAALELGALDAQTRWLDQVLAANGRRWTVVIFHQPIFTCGRPNDTERLKAAWTPIFERRGVDLILQGHDHCYSRLSNPDGRAASLAARTAGGAQGPVYVVSVAGPKTYRLNDRADWQPDRVAADTQLYQVISVEADRLAFKAFTAAGRLYDGFSLVRDGKGRKRMVERRGLPPTRLCKGEIGPDGSPCAGRDVSKAR